MSLPPIPLMPNDDEHPGEKVLKLINSRYPSYHPLLAIADLAHAKDVDARLQLDCHKTIARYVVPELKSVEVKVKTEQRRRVSISLFGQEVEDVTIVPPPTLPQATEEQNQMLDDLVEAEYVAGL